jgi:hypothetical protein
MGIIYTTKIAPGARSHVTIVRAPALWIPKLTPVFVTGLPMQNTSR